MSQFSGLTMPVFSAFGWAGQETAVKFALSQLELFVNRLHVALPQELQSIFPFFGVDNDSQTTYMASSHAMEPEPFVTFHARPLNFEMTLHITDEMYIGKLLSVAERQFDSWYAAVQQLGEDWHIRIQQMEVIEGAHPSHYQDLYKGPVTEFERDAAAEIVNRAIYLHGEEKWITPMYFTLRLHSEIVAAMGPAVIPTYREYMSQLWPLLQFIHTPRKGAGQTRAPKTAKARTPRTQTTPLMQPSLKPGSVDKAVASDGTSGELLFHYTSELKPLHLRKGFINLQPQHWPHFAVSTRTETRKVTVRFANKRDEESSVWHLVPDEQTRVVLGPTAKVWLENNFGPNDTIEVTAYKVKDTDIELSLTAVKA